MSLGDTSCIVAAGLTCGAGTTLAGSLASYAGRRNAFRRERSAVGHDGLPPTLAMALPFDQPRDATARLAALFGAAAEDIFSNGAIAEAEPAPILVLLPGWAPQAVRARIAQHMPSNWTDIRFVQGPDANALGLLGHASRAIADGRFPAVMVCAVDSLANADRMDHLVLNDAMFGRTTPYGMVPGEAAAMVLLAADASGAALGRVRDVQATIEPSVPAGGLRGRGLGQCLQKLAPALAQDAPAARLLTDLSGPRDRAEAFGVAVSAGGPAVGALAGSLEAPSLALGDLGEAFGLVLVCLALGAAPRAFPDGDVALLVTAARPAAAIVERRPAAGGGR